MRPYDEVPVLGPGFVCSITGEDEGHHTRDAVPDE